MALRDPMDMINRRRRQIHVHSILYYHFDTNLIPDHVYDAWCVELAALQKSHPDSKHIGYMPGVFADWTGETGFHLPTTDRAYWLAERLLARSTIVGHTSAQSNSSSPSDWTRDVAYKK
jgi:hypothetical protein